MQKKYTMKELASYLGCSITAIAKKIKIDQNDSNTRRFKNVYPVVIEMGKTYIMLTDEELEKEKGLSKGFNNVNNTLINNKDEEMLHNDNIIDVPYTRLNNNEINGIGNIQTIEVFERLKDVYENFTERYENVCYELAEAKKFQPLIEEKNNREGFLLNEINEIKKEKEKLKNVYEEDIKVIKLENKRLIKWLIYAIIILFILLSVSIGSLIYKTNNPTIIEKTNTIETIREVSVPVNVVENKNTHKTTRK